MASAVPLTILVLLLLQGSQSTLTDDGVITADIDSLADYIFAGFQEYLPEHGYSTLALSDIETETKIVLVTVKLALTEGELSNLTMSRYGDATLTFSNSTNALTIQMGVMTSVQASFTYKATGFLISEGGNLKVDVAENKVNIAMSIDLESLTMTFQSLEIANLGSISAKTTNDDGKTNKVQQAIINVVLALGKSFIRSEIESEVPELIQKALDSIDLDKLIRPPSSLLA